jgi:predicted kinase
MPKPVLGQAKPGPGNEVVADAVKRQHSAQRVVGDLLKAEINESGAD